MHDTPRSRIASCPGARGRAGPELCPIPRCSGRAEGCGEASGAGGGWCPASSQPHAQRGAAPFPPVRKVVCVRSEWGPCSKERRKGSKWAGAVGAAGEGAAGGRGRSPPRPVSCVRGRSWLTPAFGREGKEGVDFNIWVLEEEEGIMPTFWRLERRWWKILLEQNGTQVMTGHLLRGKTNSEIRRGGGSYSILSHTYSKPSVYFLATLSQFPFLHVLPYHAIPFSSGH